MTARGVLIVKRYSSEFHDLAKWMDSFLNSTQFLKKGQKGKQWECVNCSNLAEQSHMANKQTMEPVEFGNTD